MTPERFDELVRQVRPALWRYLARRTDPDSAADALAETLLVLWRRRADIPAVDPLPWCYAVARGALANSTRTARRQRNVVHRLVVITPPAASTVDITSADGDPDLAAALIRLSSADREIVHLWAWEGLTPRELGVVLGISANAAGIRLRRATERLRHDLRATRPISDPAGHRPDEGAEVTP